MLLVFLALADRVVNERSYTEAMFVSICLIRLCLSKMHVASVANVNSTAGLALELVTMPIRRVCAETDFVYMVIAALRDRLTAYGCKAVVMRLVAATLDLCAANDLMHVPLFAAVPSVIAVISVATATVIFSAVVITAAAIVSAVVITATAIVSAVVVTATALLLAFVLIATAAITASFTERERYAVFAVESAL